LTPGSIRRDYFLAGGGRIAPMKFDRQTDFAREKITALAWLLLFVLLTGGALLRGLNENVSVAALN